MAEGIKKMNLPNVHFIDANKEFQKIKEQTQSRDGIHYDDVKGNRPNKYLYDFIVAEAGKYYVPQASLTQTQTQTRESMETDANRALECAKQRMQVLHVDSINQAKPRSTITAYNSKSRQGR